VRMRAAERSAVVAERLPLLLEVLTYVAHPAIRSRGTVVGSIAHADPAAELPALFALLEGDAHVRGARGDRVVPARELFAGSLETTLKPGEWIDEVRLPVHAGGAFEEFARRHGDYALCGVAALAVGDRVALSFVGMGAVPERFEVADVREAVAALEPEEDIHATVAYRRRLAEQLGERVALRAREAA
jgi:CO/xanthine dehydrogenase FAD-binding subunit